MNWVNVCTFRAPDVTLIDGTVVKSDSREWMQEVEARDVLRMYPKGKRLAYIHGVEQKRGAEAAKRLRQDVWRLWEHERGNDTNTIH